MPTFYKEWLFVIALGFAGLLASPLAPDRARRLLLNPLAWAGLAAVAVLAIQSLVLEGIWRRDALAAFAAAFFVYAIAFGRRLRQGRGDDSLAFIAKCLIVAAVGSCVFALAQALVPGLPFVLPRAGPRLFGNVGQANHFVDLLWIGCLATAFLYARGSLGRGAALALVVTMQALATTSGSRMVWVYAIVLMLAAAVCWLREPAPATRRFAAGVAALVVVYAVVTVVVSLSGVLDTLGISAAEQRLADGAGGGSTAQRLWFWRVGLGAALDHPLLGVGVGRFPGEGVALAMQAAEVPKYAADAQAHNIFVHLAAECGLPLALFVAVCLVVWLVRAWRAPSRSLNTVGALALVVPILIHANLEHPLGYVYFLGLLGLIAGQVDLEALPSEDVAVPLEGAAPRASPELLRFASFAVLGAAVLGYMQYAQVERAMQSLVAQVRAGAPPQPTQELNARLAAVSRGSVFADYAELITLISAVPMPANAGDLAQRCERAMPFGPSPQLLARCATALQLAGQSARATYFADSLCKLYPNAAPVLIQSMTFVEPRGPAVAELRSSCVQRAN